MSDERRAPVQGESWRYGKRPAGTITWEEHEEVWAKYHKRHPVGQTAEEIADRHGFGYEEAAQLLGRPLHTWESNE